MKIFTHTGIRSVQSTPLVSRSGGVLGMISTHWRPPYTPEGRDLRVFDVLARQAADLIERSQAEQRLRESEAHLRQASRIKDEFLATLSHELRTPLNAVLGWAKMLRTCALRPEIVERAFESLERNARAQAQLVDDLLDVSRISSGKLQINRELVDLAGVMCALPFGRGSRFFTGRGDVVNALIGGWTLNSIVTLQSGFPFTPQLAYNPSGNGDTRNPVRPFLNPAFTGTVVTGNPNQWFDPNAFIAPPSNSGFYGNLGRNRYSGPGLATWDLSTFKDARIGSKSRLQLRVEIFNLLNRANFNTPTLITHVLQAPPNATFPEVSPVAGQVTSTSTSSRQVQLGLKLLW